MFRQAQASLKEFPERGVLLPGVHEPLYDTSFFGALDAEEGMRLKKLVDFMEFCKIHLKDFDHTVRQLGRILPYKAPRRARRNASAPAPPEENPVGLASPGEANDEDVSQWFDQLSSVICSKVCLIARI